MFRYNTCCLKKKIINEMFNDNFTFVNLHSINSILDDSDSVTLIKSHNKYNKIK